MTIPELCVPCSRKRFQPRCRVRIDGRPAEGIRDSGADMVIVRASFVPARAYTGRTVSVTLAETSLCKDLPVAKISVSTPLLDGDVEAVVMENPLADLILGNSAKMADGTLREVPVYRVPAEVAVVTRAQAARCDRPVSALPAAKPGLGQVTPKELSTAQHADSILASLRAAADNNEVKRFGKKGSFQYSWEKDILYRHYSDQKNSYKQVIVPKQFRWRQTTSVPRKSAATVRRTGNASEARARNSGSGH